MFPLPWIRDQFPALEDGSVHLDNAAGAQLPRHVLLDTVEAMTRMQVNKGGAYPESVRVTEAKERVRARTAAFLNAAEPSDVAFGANATTLVTLVAAALGGTLGAGDEIVVTSLDHHANVDPWRALERRGARVRTWRPRGPEARLEPADLAPLLGPSTRLVAVTAASNALGTLAPLAEVRELLAEGEALLMVDAVHLAPHRLPDVRAWGADVAVFSPYKVFGPHLGALYLGPRARAVLPPPRLDFLPADEPIAWEPGTQSHEAIVGFGGALRYLDELGARLGAEEAGRTAWERAYARGREHERALLERLLAGLDELGAERYGLRGPDGRTGTVSFNLPGLRAPELAAALAGRGVAVAAGHFYARDLMYGELGLEGRGGAVRASVLHYNSEEEIDRLLAELAEIAPPD